MIIDKTEEWNMLTDEEEANKIMIQAGTSHRGMIRKSQRTIDQLLISFLIIQDREQVLVA